ncbi:hypothetical protein AVEN_34021-1, partial [Araneus ventricosus]
ERHRIRHCFLLNLSSSRISSDERFPSDIPILFTDRRLIERCIKPTEQATPLLMFSMIADNQSITGPTALCSPLLPRWSSRSSIHSQTAECPAMTTSQETRSSTRRRVQREKDEVPIFLLSRTRSIQREGIGIVKTSGSGLP